MRRDDRAGRDRRARRRSSAADAWATSSSTPRASIRGRSSRPSAVSPPCATPCADPPNAVSKKCAGEIMRTPRSATTSTFAGSSSSACAPSIDEQPGRQPRRRRRAPRGTPRGPPRVSTIRNAPPDRAASRVRPRREVQRRAGRQPPHVRRRPALRERRACSTSSLRSSLRSMLRPRGVLTAIESTWSATPPSIIRGTSTWPRVPRTSRSRPEQQRVRVEVGDPERRVERARALGGGATAAPVRSRSAAPRPGRSRRRAPAGGRRPAGDRRAGRDREPGAGALTRRTRGRGSGGSGAGRCRSSPSPRPS